MSAQVVVVGAGALGSHLALLGRNLDAGWVLVDHDRVEQRNLLAQVHTRMGVGRHKTQALQQLLQGLPVSLRQRLLDVLHQWPVLRPQSLEVGTDLGLEQSLSAFE